MNEYVDIEGMKDISNTLNNVKNKIKEIYLKELKPLLNDCSINYSKYNKNFILYITEYEKLYKEIYNKLLVMTDTLDNNIIHNFNKTIDDINSLFNDKLNKINEVLINDKNIE